MWPHPQTWQLSVFFLCPVWSSCFLICHPLFLIPCFLFSPSFQFPSDFLSFFTLLLTYPPLFITINNTGCRWLSNSSAPSALQSAVEPWPEREALECFLCQQRQSENFPGNFQNKTMSFLFCLFFLLFFNLLPSSCWLGFCFSCSPLLETLRSAGVHVLPHFTHCLQSLGGKTEEEEAKWDNFNYPHILITSFSSVSHHLVQINECLASRREVHYFRQSTQPPPQYDKPTRE